MLSGCASPRRAVPVYRGGRARAWRHDGEPAPYIAGRGCCRARLSASSRLAATSRMPVMACSSGRSVAGAGAPGTSTRSEALGQRLGQVAPATRAFSAASRAMSAESAGCRAWRSSSAMLLPQFRRVVLRGLLGDRFHPVQNAHRGRCPRWSRVCAAACSVGVAPESNVARCRNRARWIGGLPVRGRASAASIPTPRRRPGRAASPLARLATSW